MSTGKAVRSILFTARSEMRLIPGSGRRLLQACPFVAIMLAVAWIVSARHAAWSQNAENKPAARAIGDGALPPNALLRFGTADLRTKTHITDFEFSPEGRFIAAASANLPTPTVDLFDVKTGRPIRRLTPPDKTSGWVMCLAISSDEKRLLWGESNGSVALWDLTTDRLLFREKLHPSYAYDVRFSPDGTLFATAGRDGKVQLRKSEEPEKEWHSFVAGNGKAVDALGDSRVCLTFTPDGTQLVAGSGESGSIFVWKTDDGKLIRRIDEAHRKTGDSFSPCLNTLLATTRDDVVISVGLQTVAADQTGIKFGATHVTRTELRYWDLKTGERQREVPLSDCYGFGYAALSKDQRLLAIGEYGRLTLRDATSGEIQRTIELPGGSGGRPMFSPDGTLVAATIQNAVAFFDVKTGQRVVQDEAAPVGNIESASWSSTGDRLVIGHSDGFVRVWDAADGRVLSRRLLAPVISRSGWTASPEFTAITADGKDVIVAGRRDDPVEFRNGLAVRYDIETGKPRWEFTMKGSATVAALSPDEKTLVAATTHGSGGDTHLYGIHAERGLPLFIRPTEEDRVGYGRAQALKFAPDSESFWMATSGCELIRFGKAGTEIQRRPIDYRTAEEIQKKPNRRPQMWHGTFSADARTLVTCTAESVYVWDVETATLRRSIRHPHDHGCRIQIAPDGKTIATADLQYVGDWGVDLVRFFDLETGEQVGMIDPGDNRASMMAFSPDGTKLLTGFGSSSAILWKWTR
jgi:WD40 repeat protein